MAANLYLPQAASNSFVKNANRTFQEICEVSFAVQTNGTLLSPVVCSLLRQLNIRVGISLDGPRPYNDLFRIDHHGAGSYDGALRGWAHANAAGIAPGLLLVANPSIPPHDLMEWMISLNPRVVDILLPDTTYDLHPANELHPPECRAYGSWLLEVFNEWARRPGLHFRIKLFDAIISKLLGQSNSYEGLGGNEFATIIIDTDGSAEPSDVLKICRVAQSEQTYHVSRHSLKDVISDPLIRRYKDIVDTLCPTCLSCDVRGVLRRRDPHA